MTGQADDRAGRDGGMGVQNRLDLGRIDVEAGMNNQLLQPANDMQRAVRIALLKGTLTWDALRKATTETLVTTSALVIIGIGASLLTRFLALSGSGDALTQAVLSFGAEPVFIIIGICAIYLLLGLFLEPLGAMLLTLPIVLPVVVDAGFDLIWFGILLTKLLEIGMITPPIGMNVFVIKGVVGDSIPLSRIIRRVAWFIAIDCVVVGGLIAYHFV